MTLQSSGWEPSDQFFLQNGKQVVQWDKWDLETLETQLAIIKRFRRATEFDFIPGRAP